MDRISGPSRYFDRVKGHCKRIIFPIISGMKRVYSTLKEPIPKIYHQMTSVSLDSRFWFPKLFQHKQWKKIRGLASYVIIGTLLYLLLAAHVECIEVRILGAIIPSAIISICINYFPSLRAVILLCIPQSLGRIGRFMFFSLLYSYIINGPASNIETNLAEIPASIECATKVTIAFANDLGNAYARPLQEVSSALRKELQHLSGIGRNFENIIDTMLAEILFVENKIAEFADSIVYARKDCYNHLEKSWNNCRQGSIAEKQNCLNFFKGKLLIEHLSGICNIVSFGETICTAFESVSLCKLVVSIPGTKEITLLFHSLTKLLNSLRKELLISIKIAGSNDISAKANQSLTYLKEKMKQSVAEDLFMLQYLKKMIDIVFILLLLLLPINAILILRKYKSGSRLNNTNRNHLRIIFSTENIKAACQQLLTRSGMPIACVLFILASEYCIFATLKAVSSTESLTITFDGKININGTVKGGLILKSFVQGLLSAINVNMSHYQDVNFRNCLPSVVPFSGYFSILVIMVSMLLLVGSYCLEGYMASITEKLLDWVFESQ